MRSVRNILIGLAIMAVAVSGVLWMLDRWQERHHINVEDPLQGRIDTTNAANAGDLLVVDSLQRIKDDEALKQHYRDSISAVIDHDPRWRTGIWRDSTKEAKLEFIIGRR